MESGSWNSDAVKLDQAIAEGIAEALRDERADPESLADSDPRYPPPLLPGAMASVDPALYSADWRTRLPEGHRARPDNPEDFVTWDSPKSLEVLNNLVRLAEIRRTGSQ